MEKSIIAEGKTTNEAIENGLKQLKVTKNMVDIKVLENEEKRSFFSILAPRVVKVELTIKEHEEKSSKTKCAKIFTRNILYFAKWSKIRNRKNKNRLKC